MTIKEFNLMKRKMYDLLMTNPEISERVMNSGRAIIFDVRDHEQHSIMICDRDSQINDNTISAQNIMPEKAKVKKLMTVTSDHNVIFH